ncbi:MAG TPA: amidohydrolase family protein [Candidatus Limnocylindria bacterium]|nr:amidohydrolase family protein [Candidatus Limnocylindria bacterium]
MDSLVIRARYLYDGAVAAAQDFPEIVIQGARIAAVRLRAPEPGADQESGQDSEAIVATDGDRPGSAHVIDLGDCTILPGLIDAHVHLVGGRKGAGEFVDAALRAMRAAADALAALRSGWTTVRDCGSGVAIGLRDAIAEGTLPGPRIVACGPMLSQTGGHGDWHDVPLELMPRLAADVLLADGPDECRRAVRRAVRAGADWIKICATGGNTSLRGGHHQRQFADDELHALVDEAHRSGRRVAAHATGRDGVLAATLAGVDSIEHGYFLDDACVEAMLQRGTFLVPTFSLHRYFADPPDAGALPASRLAKQREARDAMLERFPRAYRAGVRIATGTDCGGGPGMELGTSAREVEAQVAAGVTPWDALRHSTSGAADLLGVGHLIGRVFPGYAADLVAVSGRPWEDPAALRSVALVIRDGRLVEGVGAPAT